VRRLIELSFANPHNTQFNVLCSSATARKPRHDGFVIIVSIGVVDGKECVEVHQGVFTKMDRASSYIQMNRPRELAGRIGPDELIGHDRDCQWVMIVNN
jgi:hypothetical protein